MSREEQELNFLNGLISLNKNFFNPCVIRMPKYKARRFFDAKDPKLKVDKKFKDFLFIKKILNRCQKAGEKSIYLETEDNSKLKHMSTCLNRIHDVNKEHFCSTLKLCSPWPDIKGVEKLEKYKSKDEGKIYSSLGVVYRNDPKVRLVVQESEELFGFFPYIFKTHATVLFPPIEKKEIWTIGFVQGITKDYLEINHENEIRFV